MRMIKITTYCFSILLFWQFNLWAQISAVTNPATERTATEVKLNATLDPDGVGQLTYNFEYSENSDLSGAVSTVSFTTSTQGFVETVVTGLTPGTEYYFRIYAEETADDNNNATGGILSFYTLASPPAGSATNIVIDQETITSLDITWDAVTNANGYLIVYKQGNSSLDVSGIENGVSPSNLVVSAGIEIVDNATALTATISSLDAATEYAFNIIPYSFTNEGSPVEATYNYELASPVLITGTTVCEAPSAQPVFGTGDPITTSSIDLTWSSVADADNYIVIAKQASSVNFSPEEGTDYSAQTNANFSTAAVINDGNKVVFAGNATSMQVTGLNSNTVYSFAIYAYNTTDFCYNLVDAPGTLTLTTLSPTNSNTLTFISAAPEINSVTNDGNGTRLMVFSFSMSDVLGDGSTTRLLGFNIEAATTDYFLDNGINWEDVIFDARLVNISTASDVAKSGTINASNISFSIANGENNNVSQFGFIPEGGSITLELEIRIKENITALNIDKKNFVFELDPSTITVESGSSGFNTAPGNTIKTPDADNRIEVNASDFVFTTQPPSSITAGENMSPAPVFEARDENGNIDLDYSETFVTTNAGNITMNNAPTSGFTNGISTFPNNFNYQGSGNGRLTITSGAVNGTSSAVSVNPGIVVSELTTGMNAGNLESSTSNQAVLGFSIEALGTTDLDEVDVRINEDITGILSNPRLVSSANTIYDGVAADLPIASANISVNSGIITISDLNQTFSSETKNYFLVVDVASGVNASTPDITFSIEADEDLTFGGTVNVNVLPISQTYSFEDVTAPVVTNFVASLSIINKQDVGSETFELTITFSEAMNPAITPVVTFPTPGEDASNSLVPTASSGWSASNTVYTLVYDVSDQNIEYNVDVAVSGAEDLSGNEQITYTKADAFKIDTKAPTVTTSFDKTLLNRANETIELTATFSESMNPAQTISFVVSGSANLMENTSGTWSVSNTVYTVSFTHNLIEEETDAVSIAITDATDEAGNPIGTTDSDDFSIDTRPPRIAQITTSNNSGLYKPGDEINLLVTFDDDITVTGGGVPELNLNSGGKALFQDTVGTNQAIFLYTVGAVASGENTNLLDVLAISLAGASITDDADNNVSGILPGSPNRLQDDAAIEVDTEPAVVVEVTSSNVNGFYKAGDLIEITVAFNEVVAVTGTPEITLNTNDKAVYSSGSNSNTLVFNYTVQEADGTLLDTNDLNYSTINSLALAGGTIKDLAEINAVLELPTVAGSNSLGSNKNIRIDTRDPELSVTPFDPTNNANNVDLSNFSISFNEPVSGAGSDNIRIFEAVTSTLAATLSGSAAFTNNTASTLNFSSLSGLLNDTTQYYFEFDAGAIVDRAGNAYAGFTGAATWSFTTFGPAKIISFSDGACVGDDFTVLGKYFTGVSEIITNIGSTPSTINTFTIVDDNTIVFNVPAGTEPGTLTLRKISGQDDNPGNASTTSTEEVKIGPSSAQLVIVGNNNVCNSPEGVDGNSSPTATEIKVDVIGGSELYTIEYSDGVNTQTISNYVSGTHFFVDPPASGDNTYSLISVTDLDADLSTCSAPDLGSSITIEEFEISVVEAGGNDDPDYNFGVVDLCLADDNSIDLGSSAAMGTLPSITGAVTTGTWTIENGPSSGGGSFSSNSSVTSTNYLTPIYYPSLADAAFGEITLRLRSTNPIGNNPCLATEDFLIIRFVSTITANEGPDLQLCKELDELGNAMAIATLNGSFGGGADGLEWSRDDQFSEQGGFDGTWGFYNDPANPVYTLTSTNPQAFYKVSPQELLHNNAKLKLIPTASSGGCGGTPPPRELNLIINEIPAPTKSEFKEVVCTGEDFVKFSVAAGSNSSFIWSITSQGLSQNQFEGSTNGNSVFINFRELTTESKDTLTVREVNNLTGCISEPLNFYVTIKPLPVVTVDYARTTALSNEAGLVPLQSGNDSITVTFPTEEGIFIGPGVVLGSDSKYYLNTQALDVTDLTNPTDGHEIIFIYQDLNGCSNSDTIIFDIYDAANIFPALAPVYCQEDAVVPISVEEAILQSGNASLNVIDIFGPGITYFGGNTAEFDPLLALEENNGESNIEISYSFENPNNGTTVTNAASQRVTVLATPTPAPNPVQSTYCTDDYEVELTKDRNDNPSDNFTFELLSPRFSQPIITGNALNGFVFHPDRLLDSMETSQIENIAIQILYTYANMQGCTATDTLQTVVYRKPQDLIFASSELCIKDSVADLAVVTNPGLSSGEEIAWYPSNELIGEPLFRGENFRPSAGLIQGVAERTFYAVRRSSDGESTLCTSNIGSVTYKRINEPDFTWNRSTFGSTPIVFTASFDGDNDIDTLHWTLSRNNVTVATLVNSADIIQANFNFNTLGAGLYKLMLEVQNDFNCTSEVEKEIVIVPESNILTQYNFNTGAQGWVAAGTNNSWELATPDSVKIQNANDLWVTNASGSYNAREKSFVYSPAFNFSGLDKPSLIFDLWLDIASSDGMILEYSTDELIIGDPNKQWERLGDFENGISSGLNWYNAELISARPGTSNIIDSETIFNNDFGRGWSGQLEQNELPLQVRHILDGIPQEERSHVIFRFQFASRDNEGLPEGVAFDNFSIESRNRVVFVEYFGNDDAADDQQEMDALNNRFSTGADFAFINYRINDEDILFQNASSATLSRMFFYNAYSSQASFALDGNYNVNQPFASALSESQLNLKALEPSNIDSFNILPTLISEEEVAVNISFNSTSQLSDSARFYLAIVNKELTSIQLGIAEQKNYYNVLREFLTSPLGINWQEANEATFTFKASKAFDTLNLAVLAFFQDERTGEVFQSAYQDLPALRLSSVLSNKNNLGAEKFMLYPNPARDQVTIKASGVLEDDITGKIVDLTGKVVKEFVLNRAINQIEIETSLLKSGIYSIRLTDKKGNYQLLKLAVAH